MLPCLRARPGGLLEREDVRAVEMQSQDGGGSGWIARKRPRSVPQLTPACARKYKEYALNPCCPACGRDLVDCLSEKMFARSKCKAKMEVGADG